MSRKGKYRIEEKLNAVQEYLDDKDSMCSIANRLGIDVSAFRLWENKYRISGGQPGNEEELVERKYCIPNLSKKLQ